MSIPLQGVQDEATSGATSASPKFLPSTLAVIGTLGDHSMAHVAHALSVMGMSARDIDPVLRPLASFKKTGEDEAMAELRYSSWLRLVKSNVAALKAYESILAVLVFVAIALARQHVGLAFPVFTG